MDISLSERRQIENEMIFRRDNEGVGEALEELDAQLIEDNYPELINREDITLHFNCECSDENCDARIPMKLSKYQKIHKNRKAFIIKHNHEVDKIEEVVSTKKNYSIVEKKRLTAEPDDNLNETSVNNT